MGGSHSREGLELSDSSEYSNEDEVKNEENTSEIYADAEDWSPTVSTRAVDEVDYRLQDLKLKYGKFQSPSVQKTNGKPLNFVKLYVHIGGNTPKAKWEVSEKLISYKFVKTLNFGDEEDEDDENELWGGVGFWFLKVGKKIRVKVSTDMQMKFFGDQRRVDFVDRGVWALNFFTDEEYKSFVTNFQDFLFENVYGLRSTDENKVKIYGKDFIGWLKPEESDDSIWEDAADGIWKTPEKGQVPFPARESRDLSEEFEEASTGGGIQSLALGALDNSFLVDGSGVQVVKNFSHGIHGK
ncbi:uncharacterized protein, partial [Primulina huaijiensis]|uniref:uncharacterized protein n=1 Tax=Primulina huaijiensis TaxID=1492673 RepID=UPI003CC723E6